LLTALPSAPPPDVVLLTMEHDGKVRPTAQPSHASFLTHSGFMLFC
jgi:hypothetical protein